MLPLNPAFYDAMTDTCRNMIDTGIIDAVKVVRSALHNTASIVSFMLIIETLVADILEKRDDGADA